MRIREGGRVRGEGRKMEARADGREREAGEKKEKIKDRGGGAKEEGVDGTKVREGNRGRIYYGEER